MELLWWCCLLPFVTCHTLLALFIACAFPLGRWAMTIAFGLYFIFPMCDGEKMSFFLEPSLIQYLSDTRVEKLRIALYPNVAFNRIMKIIGIFDDFEKTAGWGIIGKTALNMDNVTILELWIILSLTTFTLAILIAYLSNVLPWTTSRPQPLLFPVMYSYWYPPTVTMPATEMKETENTARFEPLPKLDIIIECKNLVKIRGLDSKVIPGTVEKLLADVRLSDKAQAFPEELSGGMKRKLCIALALLTSPEVLILDEPTAALDPETRRSIWSLIKELRGKASMLLSTHDMEEADVLADRIIVMYSGSIICWGSPSFLKNACGVGYKLRIQKEPKVFTSAAILAVVKKTVPQATVEEEKENEAIIALNTMERRNFPVMFRQLEDGSKRVGIQSMGVSVATMQDAYIK
ncbi:hypothetical protein MTO96_006844 [Rhipicephalus appendiculatus]